MRVMKVFYGPEYRQQLIWDLYQRKNTWIWDKDYLAVLWLVLSWALVIIAYKTCSSWGQSQVTFSSQSEWGWLFYHNTQNQSFFVCLSICRLFVASLQLFISVRCLVFQISYGIVGFSLCIKCDRSKIDLLVSKSSQKVSRLNFMELFLRSLCMT